MNKRAHKVRVTDDEINAALAQARIFEQDDIRVVEAGYDKRYDLITLRLADDIRVSIPRKKLQGLQQATPAQLSKIRLLGRGTGLHWPELDVDHYVPGLLNHVFGTARWMAEIGRLGGSAKSRAKTRAARVNGKRGGRPKSAGQPHLPHHTMASD